MELLVDVGVLALLVQLLQVVHDAPVQKLAQLLVLASEQLEEDWEDDSG